MLLEVKLKDLQLVVILLTSCITAGILSLTFSFYVLGGEDLQEGQRTDFYRYAFKTPEADPGWSKLQLKGTFPSNFLVTVQRWSFLQFMRRMRRDTISIWRSISSRG